MVDATSAELLECISWQKEEPEMAREAFREFHRRFKGHILEYARHLARQTGDPNPEELARNWAGDTLRDVFFNYEKQGYFDPSQCEDIEVGVKKWLIGFIKFQKIRYLEANKSPYYIASLPDDTHPDHPFFELDVDGEEQPSDFPPRILVIRALEKLTAREREILLITMEFFDGNNSQIPKHIRQSLCQAHGISDATLRQIKSRTKRKFAEFLKEYGYSLPVKKAKTNVRSQPHE